MDKITACINGNRFIPIDTEELTALEIIGKTVSKTNEVIDEVEKKVTQGENFIGSWHGIERPTQANESISAVVDLHNEKLDNLIVLMGKPTNINDNTKRLQELLNLSLQGKKVTVVFEDGLYLFNATLNIFSNTTLKLSDKTVLKKLGVRFLLTGRENNIDDSKIMKYGGYSNISIIGGTIEGHGMSMIHATNVLIDGVTFTKTEHDHYFEIASCKNVTIKNCTFKGMKAQPSDRGFVEYIQIDSAIYGGFPGWSQGSLCYDEHPNENIIIKNNIFINDSCDTSCDLNFMGVAVGSHAENKYKHKNIVIENNEVVGWSYSAFRMITVDGLTIKNNILRNGKDGFIMRFDKCDNLLVKDNIIKDSTIFTSRIIDLVESANYKIIDNTAINLISTLSPSNKYQFVNVYKVSINGVIQNNKCFNCPTFEKEYYIDSINGALEPRDITKSTSYDTLYTGNANNTSINLNADIGKYSVLYVNIGSASTGTFMTHVATPFNTQKFGHLSTDHSKFVFLNASAQKCIVEITSQRTITYTGGDNTSNSAVRQIFGIKRIDG